MKLTAILAATVLTAGGTGYGLYSYTDLFGEKSADPSSCPVAKSPGCPFCNRGKTDADTTTVTPAGEAAAAVAGPVALFPPAVKVSTKADCCAPAAACCPAGPCCDDAAKVSAKKADCCPTGACCPTGPCCGVAKGVVMAASCCPVGVCCPTGPCCATAALTGTAVLAAKK